MFRRLSVLLCLVGAAALGTIGYVESSSGLQDSMWEGGRTELEFADVNNDGDVDIISIGDHGNPGIQSDEHGVLVYFGDGAGAWSMFEYGDFGYGGIAVGDVNGDGLWDIGYGMHHDYSGTDLGDQVMEVALGDGTGRMWTAWDDSLAAEGQDWGMFATDFGDIDNDGDLDVGSISFGADDGIWVYLNLENGAWRRSFGFAGGNSRMQFYFRDVNRDGNADLLAAHGTGTVWFGNGAGDFTPAGNGLPSSSYGLEGLSVGDADGDGGCDVAFTNSSGGVEAWVWSDSGQAWQSFSNGLPPSGGFDGTQLCDMDCDGHADVVAFGGASLKVWTGDGQGNWVEAAALTTPTPGYYEGLRAGGDFDHNGRPDITLLSDEGSWPNDHNWLHAYRETTSARTLGVFPVFPRGREKFLNGSVQFVDWVSEVPGAEPTWVRLELSTTGSSGPWTLVADSLRNAGRYQWLVPDSAVSGDCHLRYTVFGPSGMAQAVTPRAFVIGDTTVGLAVEGQRWHRSLALEPSLGSGLVLIRFGRVLTGPALLSVSDVSGREILRRGIDARAGRARLDLRGSPSGAYFLRLFAGGMAASGKFVVRR